MKDVPVHEAILTEVFAREAYELLDLIWLREILRLLRLRDQYSQQQIHIKL